MECLNSFSFSHGNALHRQFRPTKCHILSKQSSNNSSHTQETHKSRRKLITKSLWYVFGALLAQHAHPTPPAFALNFGISGPKEWLKQQKRKSAQFLLAPIQASRDYLSNAFNLIKKKEDDMNGDGISVENLVKSAARDCIPLEQGSFVEFQANTGVEVCTFRLILKNAASLLDDSDPIKLKADAAFENLVRSFSKLNDSVERYEPASVSYSDKVGFALEETMTALTNFETSMRECLDI